MDKKNFAQGVDRLINPIDVGTLHFMQAFNRLLPKFIQNALVESSSKTTPYMGFVVEPYSYFLCYEITDIAKAKKLLPDGFDLVKTKIFTDDEPKYYCIFGSFRAHTSAFWGTRVEFYIIAEDQKTGLLSWIIVDYDSNTISHDKMSGLRSPNSTHAVVTINHQGTVFVDVTRDDKSRKLVFSSNIEQGRMKPLNQRLWLEGNLSIGYGRVLSDGAANIFSLKFDPAEVEKALEIPKEDLHLEANTWFPGLFEKEPPQILCFPYAQHFISDSPGHTSNLKNRDELEAAVNNVNFQAIKVFSTKGFRNMFLLGMATSLATTLLLVSLLLLK